MIDSDKKRRRPVRAEAFKIRMERFKTKSVFIIPAIFASECSMVLEAYFGGPIRAGLHLIYWGVRSSIARQRARFLWAISDRVGWTRLQQIPDTPCFERHGGQCKYHNCMDSNCIDKSVPKWFRWLTR